jgi:hypothetical protein
VTDFDLWRMMMLGNPSSCYYMLQLSVWSFVSFYFHGIFNILVFVYFHITSGNTWTAKLIICFIAGGICSSCEILLVVKCVMSLQQISFYSPRNVFFFFLVVCQLNCLHNHWHSTPLSTWFSELLCRVYWMQVYS